MKHPKTKAELNNMSVEELCEFANSLKIPGQTKAAILESLNIDYKYADITNAISRLGGENLWVPSTNNKISKYELPKDYDDDILNITIPNSKKQVFRGYVPKSLCEEFDTLFKYNRTESFIAALTYYIDISKHKRINVIKQINNPDYKEVSK